MLKPGSPSRRQEETHSIKAINEPRPLANESRMFSKSRVGAGLDAQRRGLASKSKQLAQNRGMHSHKKFLRGRVGMRKTGENEK
jgi:hypothetical protein